MANKYSAASTAGCSPRPKYFGAPSRRRTHQILNRIIDYVLSNPISFITAVGAILGGITMLIYLGSENYFPPDFNASSLGVLLGAAAIVGIAFVVAMGWTFILPGVVYSAMEGDSDARSVRLLLFYPSSVSIFGSLAYFYGWLAGSGCLIFTLVLIVCVCVAEHQKKDVKEVRGWVKRVWSSVKKWSLIGVLEWISEMWPSNKAWGELASTVVLVLLNLLPLLTILNFAIAYENDGDEASKGVLLILEMASLATLANFVIAGVKKWWAILAAAFATVFFAVTLFNQWSLIPRAVAHTLSIGDVRNATLQLNEQGCQIALKYAALEKIESLESDGKLEVIGITNKNRKMILNADHAIRNAKPAMCTISKTTIAWRIGNEYAIDATDKRNGSTSSLDFTVEVEKSKFVPMLNVKSVSPCTNVSKANCRKIVLKIPVDLTYELNSKFTMPSGHVLSWSVSE